MDYMFLFLQTFSTNIIFTSEVSHKSTNHKDSPEDVFGNTKLKSQCDMIDC